MYSICVIKHSIKTIIKVAAILFFILGTTIAGLGIWIYGTPREISFVTHYLSRQINSVIPPSLRVEIGGSLIKIDENLRLLVEVTDFKIISKTKAELSTSGIALMIDPLALFPQTPHKLLNITISNPSIINNVLDDARSLGSGNGMMIEQLNKFLNTHARILMKFSFSIADIDLDFTKGERTSTLRIHQLILKPDIVNHNIVFDIYGDLSVGKKNNILKARIDTSSEKHLLIEGEINKLSNLTLLEFGTNIPALEGADIEMDMQFKSLLKSFRLVEYFEFELFNYHGSLKSNNFFQNDIKIKQLKLQGYCNNNCQELFVDNFHIVADQLDVIGNLEFVPLNGHPTLKMNFDIQEIPVKMVEYYWPKNMISRTKDWIFEHIRAGRVTAGHAELLLNFDEIAQKRINESAINISLEIEDATLQYLEEVDEMDSVNASLKIANDNVTFHIRQAFIKNVVVDDALGEITNLASLDSEIKVQASLIGSAEEMLKLALQHSNRQAVMPYQISGDAIADIKISLPLRDENIMIGDIKMSAEAHINDFGVQNILDKLDFTNGSLDVKLANHLFMAQGTAQLLGSASKINASYDMLKDDINVQLVSNFAWEKLRLHGMKIPDIVSGQVEAAIELQQHKNAIVHKVRLDLTDSTVSYQTLGLHKEPKVHGSLSFTHQVKPGEKHLIENYHLKLPNLKSIGSAILDANMRPVSINSESTSWYRGAFSFNFIQEGELSKVMVAGDSVDIKALKAPYHSMLQASHLGTGPQGDKSKSSGLSQWLIEGSVNKIYMHNDVVLFSPLFRVHQSDSMITSLTCMGHFEDQNVMDINLVYPKLSISSSDGGSLIKGFNLSDKIKDGYLVLNGTMQDKNFEGNLVIENYYMRKAPALAKLLSLVSISSIEGIAALFDQRGMRFKQLECPLQLYGGMLSVNNCLASGPSLSMTASGYLDFPSNTMEVHGTLAPENIISTTLRYVPFLGNALLSQKDQSLFGTSYSIRGPIDDPKVTANPLSILVPNKLKDAMQ